MVQNQSARHETVAGRAASASLASEDVAAKQVHAESPQPRRSCAWWVHLRSAFLQLLHRARVIQQRRVNRLRIGALATERDQVVSPLMLRELAKEGTPEEVSDVQRDHNLVSEGVDLVAKHLKHHHAETAAGVREDDAQKPAVERVAIWGADHTHISWPVVLQQARRISSTPDGSKSMTHWAKGSRISTGTPIANGTRFRLQWILEHRYFTYTVSLVVCLNLVFIFIDEEYWASERLGNSWQPSDTWASTLSVIDIIFTTLFCLEVAVRLLVEGLTFFCNRWNILDISLAVTELLSHSLTALSNRRASWLRIARLGRLLWILQFFESLWVIVVGVLCAYRTIAWTLVLLFIILYCFAIMTTKMVGQPLRNWPIEGAHLEAEDVALLRICFGSIPESMFTLLTMVTLEGWSEIARVLAKYSSGAASLISCFIFFSLTTWGLMNMVAAVMIEATVGKALHHLENYVKITAAERYAAIKKICDCFFRTGVDTHGLLHKNQFIEALDDKEFVNRLHDVGVDLRQAHTLFDLLDCDQSGALNLNEFTEGVLDARGSGHAMDVLRLKYDLQRSFHHSQAGVAEVWGDVDAHVDKFAAEAQALTRRLTDAAHSCCCDSPDHQHGQSSNCQ